MESASKNWLLYTDVVQLLREIKDSNLELKEKVSVLEQKITDLQEESPTPAVATKKVKPSRKVRVGYF